MFSGKQKGGNPHAYTANSVFGTHDSNVRPFQAIAVERNRFPSQIGFGLIELHPASGGGEFTFEYQVPSDMAARITSGQVAVFPAALAQQYDEIPVTGNLLARVINHKSPDGNLLVKASVKVAEPQLMIVAFGPYEGTFTLSKPTPSPVLPYKIAATASVGSEYEWIDQDAGDLTFFNFSAVPGLSHLGEKIAIDVIRDKRKMLSAKETYSIRPFVLHPAALKRVELLDANW